jgi:hypothetical protein
MSKNQWLISYKFRRVFRLPSGELQFSDSTSDRTELLKVHPAAFLANTVASYSAFVDQRSSDIAASESVVRIYSAIPVSDDALTVDEQQALEEAFTERPICTEAA